MSNLAQRILSGLIGGGIFIAALWLSPISFSILFFILMLLTAHEYDKLMLVANPTASVPRALNLLLYLIIYLILVAVPMEFAGHLNLHFVIPFISLFFLIELFQTNANPFERIGYKVLGLAYIVIPFALATYIAMPDGEFNPSILLGIILLIWSNDIGAYFTGSLIGKHKLFERISPKKTIEGSVGGLLMAILASYLISNYFDVLSSVNWMMLAVVCVLFGSLGDLVESQLKRSLKIKDSGNIIPGHGGLLDRFDALIFALPFTYAFLKFIGTI